MMCCFFFTDHYTKGSTKDWVVRCVPITGRGASEAIRRQKPAGDSTGTQPYLPLLKTQSHRLIWNKKKTALSVADVCHSLCVCVCVSLYGRDRGGEERRGESEFVCSLPLRGGGGLCSSAVMCSDIQNVIKLQ